MDDSVRISDEDARYTRDEDMVDDLAYDGTTDYDWQPENFWKGIWNGAWMGFGVWALIGVVIYFGFHV